MVPPCKKYFPFTAKTEELFDGSKFMSIPRFVHVCPPSIDRNAGTPNIKSVLSAAEIFVGPSNDGPMIKDLFVGVISRHVDPESAEWKSCETFCSVSFDSKDSGLQKIWTCYNIEVIFKNCH